MGGLALPRVVGRSGCRFQRGRRPAGTGPTRRSQRQQTGLQHGFPVQARAPRQGFKVAKELAGLTPGGRYQRANGRLPCEG
eukprot:5551682-Pyramimonas_sp.AAC.1